MKEIIGMQRDPTTVPDDMDLEIHFSVPHLVKGLVCPLVAGDDVVQVAANEIPNLGTYGGALAVYSHAQLHWKHLGT
jgi:hypothetical protein